ncbi:MAG TPA: cytochrome c peroxidase [Isosphaeraceae bacterium]|nr:cytochrome c peroxidase [Isosphaeraceae bacterium]
MTRDGVDWPLARVLIGIVVVAMVVLKGTVTLLAMLRPDDGQISGVPQAPLVPVAVAWPEPDRLIVALRDDRSLIFVNPEKHEVERRLRLGLRPNDLAVAEDGLLAIGGQEGEIEVREPDGFRRFLRTCGRGPTRVEPLADNRLAAACLWDRRVLVLDGKTGEELASHPLPFEPGVMLSLPDGGLLVADAFGGRLATLRPGEPGSEQISRLDAVNIRGLALSGDRTEILLVHMASSGPTQVTRTNVDWGLILASKLTAVKISDLNESRPSFRQLNLDGSGHGAADPSGIAVSPDGHVIHVSLSGAHQVLRVDRRLGGPSGPDLHPLGDSNRIGEAEVGQSPLGIALAPTGSKLATADAMSDSVTILAADDLKPIANIALNESPIQRSAAQRGEALFVDGRRALDRWMSCASCHPGGHTVSLRFDTLGDGTYGNPKDTPSLLGVGQTPPFAWTGRFRSLEDQVEQSMLTSLHGPHPSEDQVADVAAYLATLQPPPPIRAQADEEIRQGQAVFQARRCDTCHTPPTFSSRPLRNPDIPGIEGLYSTPSLLGVERTPPYFHDSSAPSLDVVLERHHPGFEDAPTAADREVLLAYLRALGARP